MENENNYVYIEMMSFDQMKNIIQDEFNKNINTKKYEKTNMCPYTGFQNNKKKTEQYKINNFRSTMTGPFNF